MKKKNSGETKDLNAEKEQKQAAQKKIGLNQILKPILFLVASLILEIINFTSLGIGVLPKFILFDLGVALLFAGLIFVCGKNWLSNILFFVFIIFQCFLNILNGTIMKSTDDVFFFELLALTAEGMSSFDMSFVDVNSIINNSLFVLIVIATVLIIDIFGKQKQFRIKQITKPLLLFLTFFASWVVGLSFYSAQVYSIYKRNGKDNAASFYSELWTDQEYKLVGLKSFGTYGFYVKDFYNTYFKKVDYDAQKDDYVKWIKQGEVAANEDAELFGQNLIVVCMESMDNFAIDPYNTPTLYKLIYEDGITAENFYSKNKTNISEDISILGYIPKTSKLNLNGTNSLTTYYSLPNLFNRVGYQTSYFHSYVADFYDRETINKNLGFSNLYFIEDADFNNKSTEFNMWNSEVDYFNSLKDKMIPTDKPFFSFYMTVSSHGIYDQRKPALEQYYDIYDQNFYDFKAWLESETPYKLPTDTSTLNLIKNFKSAAIDTDQMLKTMIEDLQAKNLYDNTTIVLFADHDCFYNELSSIVKGYNGIEKYHLPLAIYNANLGHSVISNFTTVYNIYPTICELYGLAYNKNMCHGVSLLDSDQSNNLMYSVEGRVGFFDLNFQSETLLEFKKLNNAATDEDYENFLTKARALKAKQKKFNFIYSSGWSSDILK